jgi:hypothetical protein
VDTEDVCGCCIAGRSRAFDPNPSFANDRYRKPYLPSYFEHIEQLAGNLFTFIGNGGRKNGEFPQKPQSERVRFKQFWQFCSKHPKTPPLNGCSGRPVTRHSVRQSARSWS